MRKHDAPHDAPVEGLYPGVVAIVGDADMLCLDCARKAYGESAVQWVVEGTGLVTDREGNFIGAVFADSEDTRDIDAEIEYAREHPRARRRIISRYCWCGARFYY